MAIVITDLNEFEIGLSDGFVNVTIWKQNIRFGTITGDILPLMWHNKAQTETMYKRDIDWNDVTAPVVASAAALQTAIENMIKSGWSAGGGVASVSDDGGGVVVVDNTDPVNPIVGFGGVNVDGNTITGDGTVGSPLVGHSAAGANLWSYKAKTTITSGNPTTGHLIWDNATQTSATQLNLSHITDDGFDIDLYFPYIVTGDVLIVQDRDDSTNYQKWIVSGATTIIPNSYVEVPVTLDSSGGTGTTNFANSQQLLVAKFSGSAAISDGDYGDVIISGSGTIITAKPISNRMFNFMHLK